MENSVAQNLNHPSKYFAIEYSYTETHTRTKRDRANSKNIMDVGFFLLGHFNHVGSGQNHV